MGKKLFFSKLKKELIVVLLLLLVSIHAVKALLQPGGFTSHDLTHHVIRQIDMDRLLSEGQFPPRWSGELNNGYGYPVFLFNYPLPVIVGELFHKLGLNFVDSVKAVLLVSLLGSVLGMYLFLKELLKDQAAAFLGSLFYLYAPIRFLNVYVSASLGGALGLMFVPWIFWAVSSGRILIGALIMAGLILSHNVTALMFLPIILVFSLFSLASRPPARLILMFVLGLGLSAFFWLPALVEKQYTQYDLIMAGFYKDHFPTIWQLIYSPWGYGLSHPGTDQDALSFQIGKIHILVMLILIPMLWVFRKIREIKVVGGITLGLFLLSIFLMLDISVWLWDNLPLLALVQFPARFLALAVFMSAITAGLLIKYLPFKGVIFVMLAILVIYANRNHWNINQRFDPGEEYYLDLKTTSTAWGEHLPKWGKIMEKPSERTLEFVRGVGEIRIIRDQSAQVLAEVETISAAKLRFNQLYFPGWQIKVDGRPTRFNYLIDGESYGLPVIDIDKGKHLVLAEFKNTPVRNLADGISVITVIMVILSLWKLLPHN